MSDQPPPTRVLAAAGDPPPSASITAAVEALRAGHVIAIPTDTVYGLAADPRQPAATAKVFDIKGRPGRLELPVLVSGAEQAREIAADLTDVASTLMARLWPGPLTLVVARAPDFAARLGDGGATVGLRAADHPVTLAICASFGPIAVTSANRHGEAPAQTAAQASALPGLGLVVDGGPCRGEPSTVLDCTGAAPVVLRRGALAWSDIEEALGRSG